VIINFDSSQLYFVQVLKRMCGKSYKIVWLIGNLINRLRPYFKSILNFCFFNTNTVKPLLERHL